MLICIVKYMTRLFFSISILTETSIQILVATDHNNIKLEIHVAEALFEDNFMN
jgi:hypothetical protein